MLQISIGRQQNQNNYELYLEQWAPLPCRNRSPPQQTRGSDGKPGTRSTPSSTAQWDSGGSSHYFMLRKLKNAWRKLNNVCSTGTWRGAGSAAWSFNLMKLTISKSATGDQAFIKHPAHFLSAFLAAWLEYRRVTDVSIQISMLRGQRSGGGHQARSMIVSFVCDLSSDSYQWHLWFGMR